MEGITAQREIEEKSKGLIELSSKIWENPEIAYKEVKACKWTAEFLQKEGFKVETGYAGVPTAIRAVWGDGKPVIGFLGEYDALPNMSQKISARKEAIMEGAPGHACGHSLLGVAHVGAVIGLKKEMKAHGLKGTVVFYGCPAEEVLTGKTFMARGGAFKELDMAIAWHPGPINNVNFGIMAGLNSAIFHFKGITSHAGGDPYNGRSALDAAELMNVGANFLREHVTEDVRLHYAFTDVHSAPNVVPDKTSVWYYVRALSREAVEATYERLVKVAKGAAMMTETEVNIEFLGGCYSTLQNKVLGETVQETMKEIPLPEWTPEEKEFAAKLDTTSANYKRMVESGQIKEGTHLHDTVSPIMCQNMSGSTDVGDVMHIVPGVFFTSATSNIGAAYHSWHSAACAGHSIGMKGMLYAAKVMAVAGLKAIKDSSIIEKAKTEFDESMNGRVYTCPIPDDIPVPSGE
ncbi:MAG: amidohydrolase [Hungatella sp.]|jgi:aminobenzoyl-glutamate utilization protein B|nr:amidohydrolase [Hungatella sp.]